MFCFRAKIKHLIPNEITLNSKTTFVDSVEPHYGFCVKMDAMCRTRISSETGGEQWWSCLRPEYPEGGLAVLYYGMLASTQTSIHPIP